MPDSDALALDARWIVYADDSLVVVNKPPGLLSVPGRGLDKQDCASLRVAQSFKDALVVHRLDMSTSGLLVMARGLKAQRYLSAAFAQRMVRKRYHAIVSGCLHAPQGEWQSIALPIAVDWPNRPRRVIDHDHGQASTTRVRWTLYNPHTNTSHVELEPITGRSHQLRVHMMAIGHPILGDALYAPEALQAQADRLLLHATSLSFIHPSESGWVRFDSPTTFPTVKPIQT
ncbi:RluA family pseudouridine synthase [Rhodoferax aquaticus]|uniref:Dual-specificity RNA pseudouridine synthase RluA n=1 Tax=Rhodoferax aquaticus TaxID=2527691 RepID=A0A515ESJ4_9BURK|nr:RluA family pseudouridine synthase [Rhodoferax aquaticus]QDL55598.1 RluA family pseudouridine synthase [Rhodoferax aquaticus]